MTLPHDRAFGAVVASLSDRAMAMRSLGVRHRPGVVLLARMPHGDPVLPTCCMAALPARVTKNPRNIIWAYLGTHSTVQYQPPDRPTQPAMRGNV